MIARVMQREGAASAEGTSRLPRADLVVVFGLALAVRLLLVVTSRGGFGGNYGYDASVYYAASDALIHGRAPYADFVLLHPPGLSLVLTPFTLLGRLTSDHTGFVTANVTFSALGALNAVLVVLVARRLGSRPWASLLGGGFYAVWLSAAGPEISARLEPLGTFAFLVGLLLLTRHRTSRRVLVAAGAALGFAVTVKAWWIVPLLVLVGWFAFVARDRRRAGCLLGGAVATLVVVLTPFWIAAPGPMWRMIVADQFGRPAGGTVAWRRVFALTSAKEFGSGRTLAVVVTVVTAVVVVLLVRAAWRHRAARPIIVVLVAQVLVLLVSPTYFTFYSGYAAAGAALLVAVAATPRTTPARVSSGLVPAAAVGVAVIATATALVTGHAVVPTSKPLAVGRLPAEVARVRCVVSDSPMALIVLDTLSRGLADGCPNQVDVSGRSYDLPAASGRQVGRRKNPRWQADILRYLRSGQAVVVIRRQTGLSSASRREIRSLPVLARSGRIVVYRSGR